MESDWSDDSGDSSVSSSDSDESTIPRQQGRKRLRHVEQWKRKKRKILKDSGKAHETYKGTQVSSKAMKLSLAAAKTTVLHAFVWQKENAFLTTFTS